MSVDLGMPFFVMISVDLPVNVGMLITSLTISGICKRKTGVVLFDIV